MSLEGFWELMQNFHAIFFNLAMGIKYVFIWTYNIVTRTITNATYHTKRAFNVLTRTIINAKYNGNNVVAWTIINVTYHATAKWNRACVNRVVLFEEMSATRKCIRWCIHYLKRMLPCIPNCMKEVTWLSYCLCTHGHRSAALGWLPFILPPVFVQAAVIRSW